MTSTIAPDRTRASPNEDVLLRATGLHKSFGGVRALRDISLTIPAGAIIAVIGPNGAGKSTLLNLLSGIYPPDAGSIVFDGNDLTALPAYRRVHYGLARTFQKIRLFKHLSAIENVVAGFHIHHHIPAWDYVVHGPAFRRNHERCRDEAARLLTFMGLERRAQIPAGSLSYGEQRMLEIARALATAPRLLMVDEPAAGLSAAEVEMLLDRIRILRRDGLTLCIVEHNMDLVMKLADRVLVIDYGQFLFEGAPAQVQSHPAVIDAYLGAQIQ
jgi:ABC-type branched-subunit amino acid transport system ATPase component